MTDIVARLRDWPQMTPVACKEAAAEIERLQAALELLKIAVDHEGWPAGWGQIRQQVNDALSDAQKAEKL